MMPRRAGAALCATAQDVFIMITRTEHGRSNSFLIGLVTGGAIGAALAIVFAPRANDQRQRSAR